jgi:hypothetical protein
MRVLADLHHLGLYKSLYLLFEERLGMELYRPIGSDWFAEGFFWIAENYGNDWQTINQFLSPHQEALPDEPRYRLNQVDVVENGVYHIGFQRAIELQTFKKMKFDYIIASIPKHYREFTRLRDLYQPDAKVICQVGNKFDFPWEWAQNILTSSKYDKIPDDKNVIHYHQEFPLDIFSFSEVPYSRRAGSFLHLFNRYKDYPLWLEIQQHMSDWTFKEYGAEGKEKYLGTDKELADAMQMCDLIFHFKDGGDGYGHIIHNIFAMGRVVVTKEEYYKDSMAGDLMVDGVTCLFWRDGKDIAWNIARILEADLGEIGANAFAKFTQVVDFEKEAEDVRGWLEEL